MTMLLRHSTSHVLLFVALVFAPSWGSLSPHGSTPEVSLGTTLVAICFQDGVVVGADTRTSLGDYVANRYADKIAPVLDKAAVCRSGSAADTQYLAEQCLSEFQSRYYRYGTKPTLKQIAHLLRSMVSEDQSSALLCAGYDDDEKRGRIYSISPSGALMEEESGFSVGGSGSTFILGHFDHHFRHGMDETTAVKFVADAVRLAMGRDGSSGGFVRIRVITKEGSRVQTVYPDHSVSTQELDSRLPEKLTGFASPLHTGPPKTP